MRIDGLLIDLENVSLEIIEDIVNVYVIFFAVLASFALLPSTRTDCVCRATLFELIQVLLALSNLLL